jgi:hypothetical protein
MTTEKTLWQRYWTSPWVSVFWMVVCVIYVGTTNSLGWEIFCGLLFFSNAYQLIKRGDERWGSVKR